MKIITLGPNMGKTTELINIAKTDPKSVIVVHSIHEIHRLKQYIPVEQLSLFNPELFRGRDINLYIDNADLILQSLVSKPIKAITITADN